MHIQIPNLNLSGVLAFLAFPSLTLAQATFPLDIAEASTHVYNLDWPSDNLRRYQMQTTPDLLSWFDYGDEIIGTGNQLTMAIESVTPELFFRVTTPPIRPGFAQHELAAEDDHSSEDVVELGFEILLFGVNRDVCWVNNNGNVTFDEVLPTWTPFPLQALGIHIISPFWADVDTRLAGVSGSRVTKYGTGMVEGRPAFGVNWLDVGYFLKKVDKLNRFQLVIIERNDTGLANFDVEFNYSQILWETGDVSGGANGYGGYPARTGITNGTDRTIELEFSGQPGAQLDSATTGLIYGSRNSTIPGRYVFQVRSGAVLGALNINAGADRTLNPGVTTTTLAGSASNPAGGTVTVLWSVFKSVPGEPAVSFSNPAILNPVVTIPTTVSNVTLMLTATSSTTPPIGAADIIQIVR